MRRPMFALLPLLTVAGCTVGPNFDHPSLGPVEQPSSFMRLAFGLTDPPLSAMPSAPWWTVFGDPVLNTLETAAYENNSDVAIAVARLRQARAEFRVRQADRAPTTGVTALGLHGDLPSSPLSGSNGRSSLDFIDVSATASWEIDLFGGKLRSVEASRASRAAAEADLADVRVSLCAQLAQIYLNLRARQLGAGIMREKAAIKAIALSSAEARVRAGTLQAGEADRLRTLLAQTRSEQVDLENDANTLRDALATLTGKPLGEIDALTAGRAEIPLPPAAIAIGNPATLIQRRPDIRAAEERLHAETANIGVAESARFPKLSLMGVIGMGGSNIGDAVDPSTLAALALPRLTWNFLDFGRNAARVEAARGKRDEADARYRKAILLALQDAEDSLSNFCSRREKLNQELLREQAAQRQAVRMTHQFNAGTARLADRLTAQEQGLDARLSLQRAQAATTISFVMLQKALGLGWQGSRSEITKEN